jgi:8-oxo-dGTP pyrophosphatase MutT (NUDIX family)
VTLHHSTTLYQIEAQIRVALASALPGADAHLTLAPQPRRARTPSNHGWQPGDVPSDSRSAAGLLLLYPADDQTHFVLTVRAGSLPQHAGQVCLPGGALESEETVDEAAVREAAEEIALDPGAVRLLGHLSPLYIPVSGFTLHPVAAVSDRQPRLRPASEEVARILEVPVAELQDRSRLKRGTRWREGAEYRVPYFELGGERVWGATAMVLAELLHLLGTPPGDPWALTSSSGVQGA